MGKILFKKWKKFGGDKNKFPDIIEPLDRELNSKDSEGMENIVDNDDVWKNIDFKKNSFL